MSWRRWFTFAAALSAVGVMFAVVGIHLTGGTSERSIVENLVFVPVVAGKDEKVAISAIEAAGLRPHVTYRRFRGRHGRVIAQSPVSRFASRGDSVSIVMSAARTQPPPDYLPFTHW